MTYDAITVILFKNKADCGKYCGSFLLSTVGKILAQVTLSCLVSSVSGLSLPESQCGFRPGNSTIDTVFSLRQAQEKWIEQHMDLYVVFIDLNTAFATVKREALWVILTKLGYPQQFSPVIWTILDGMMSIILSSGDI